MKQLGDILLQGGLVTEDQLFKAFQLHKDEGKALGRVLVDHGFLTESQLVAALAQQIGLEFVDLGEYPVDGSIVARVSGAICRKHSALPLRIDDEGKLLLAMADPANVFAIDDIRSITGYDVRPVVATRADVLGAIDRYYRADSDLDDLTAVMEADEEDDLSNLKEVVEDAPIVKYVNLLITQAIQDRASDIHLEPTERALVVRYRIDGVLHEVMQSPKNIQ
ncbi:MAG: ATPase, T2SS/T4P/T4SS family, partial [Candidatus Nanopelagicales bacterium]